MNYKVEVMDIAIIIALLVLPLALLKDKFSQYAVLKNGYIAVIVLAWAFLFYNYEVKLSFILLLTLLTAVNLYKILVPSAQK